MPNSEPSRFSAIVGLTDQKDRRIASSANIGLSTSEARVRLLERGPNQIFTSAPTSFFGIAREEVAEPMILLLIFTGVVYSLLGSLFDALTIFGVILLLVLSEVWTEYRAKSAIAALAKLAAVKTRVRRDARLLEVDTLEVVPGDILILTQGTKINADAAVTRSVGLQLDESALTGEAYPAQKDVDEPIWAGTFIASGEGEAMVTVTGGETRLGRIAAKTKSISVPRTALQLATKSLASKLVYVALAFAVLIPLLGVARGQDWHLMLLTGLALAFAVIPEELPIVITMVLGLGSYRLSKNRLLVKQLRTAEALGNTTVILTDKTGTVTEGRMQVAATYPPDSPAPIQAALQCIADYARGSIKEALQAHAAEVHLTTALPTLVRWRDLGQGRKTEAAIRGTHEGLDLTVSGAPEEVFAASADVPAEARAELERMTGAGWRVIAVAGRRILPTETQRDFAQLEQGLTLAGLIALEDPPRPGVKESISTAAGAGIRTIMVTGDHPTTAAHVAGRVGIANDRVTIGAELEQLSDAALQQTIRTISVFARTTPEQKYRLVRALQANHEVVTVTGDGINDVLALKAADIGIAMGLKGTDVAKEAAGAVLADDNFNTICLGIFEARGFFDNLSKGMRYYLAIKLALILIFLMPVLLGIPLPFAPIQIIILELFMDLAASAGFTAEPKEKDITTRPPRDPQESVFNARAVRDIAIKAILLFVAVTGVYLFAWQSTRSLPMAQSYAFAAWIVGHIVVAYISRSDHDAVPAGGIFANRVINLWALAAIAFLLAGLYLPVLSGVLRLTPLPVGPLLASLAVVIAVLSLLEGRKLMQRNRRSSRAGSSLQP